MFTAYTPVWEEDGKRFKAWIEIGWIEIGWIEIGSVRRDQPGEMFGQIDGLPINAEEDFTGAVQFIEGGAPPPTPLTVTREEFLESNLAREYVRRITQRGG